MNYFYFDSGTTNTRAYLISDGSIIDRSEMQIGSRDSALGKDRRILIQALKNLYDEVLSRACITEENIASIYMSGMVSCPSGLLEIEHLSTPVDFNFLKSSIISYEEPYFFKRIIHIVPGIKTLPQGITASLQTVVDANNMRGEETEIFGILHRCPQLSSGHSIIILPGSHTQVAFVRNGRIEDISSNITGELYHALITETILGSSLVPKGTLTILPEFVRMGYDVAHRYGFNRALYVVRSMDLFSDSTISERVSYMEGVLNGGVMDAIIQVMGTSTGTIAIAGPHKQYEIFSAFTSKLFPQFRIIEVPCNSEIPFSVEGFLCLADLL